MKTSSYGWTLRAIIGKDGFKYPWSSCVLLLYLCSVGIERKYKSQNLRFNVLGTSIHTTDSILQVACDAPEP